MIWLRNVSRDAGLGLASWRGYTGALYDNASSNLSYAALLAALLVAWCAT